MRETITLYDALKIVRKQLLYIMSFALFLALITAFLSFFIIKPTYEAETQLLINQKNTAQSPLGVQQMETDLRLINTYNVIIQSPAILSNVISQLNLTSTPEKLKEKITVSNASNSQVVNIAVRDQKPAMAVNIANTVAEVFQEEIQVLMTIDNINILSVAKLDDKPEPVAPNKTFYIAAATIIGFIVSAAIALLVECFDTKVKTEQDVEEKIGLPIIGIISKINDAT
ncbi:YveK family protein [Lysinibacillus sp. NPDC097195]|uniref:YveK family protein n=1 Tax=Lysinibacillus sp. NPDC097195 TaxID=3364141 RepID=UPI00382E782E